MTTPAEELRSAATTLRQTAAEATRGPWVFYPTITRLDDNDQAWTICRPYCEKEGTEECEPDCGRDVLKTGAEHCEDDHVDQADAVWMTLMHPGLAEPLAAWLEHVAEVWAFSKRSEREHALAVARALNGGAAE